MKNQNEVRKFLRQHAADKAALAKLNVGQSVGANHGFRKAAVNSSEAELLSLKVGEDARLRHALALNGKLPNQQNGTELLPKYRRMLNRSRAEDALWASWERVDARLTREALAEADHAAFLARVALVNAHRSV